MSDSLNSMPQQPIVILGSGIAGLTLGRCLRQKGIPTIIYEKATSTPRHSYGITLHEWAYKPLLQVLNIDEHSFRRRVAVDSLYHAGTGKISQYESTPSLVNHSESFRANRSKLEFLLKEGQDVNWDHDLRDSQSSPDGRGSTRLTFQNKLKLSSLFVVDTLGVHSQLRQSLLPDCNPKVLPFVVFCGKRHVKHDEFSKTYAPYLKDANILTWNPARDRTVLLQIRVDDHLPNGDVKIAYVYSRTARCGHNQPQPQPDPLHNPSRSTGGATEIPDAFYDELQRLSTNAELPDPFSSTFDPTQIRRDRVLHWLMRTLLVSPADLRKLLYDNGVVIIGDSTHPMPILGGDGANHAMKDAVELAEVIAAPASPTTPDLSSPTRLDKTAVERFYDKCASRWRDAIRDSEERITRMHQV